MDCVINDTEKYITNRTKLSNKLVEQLKEEFWYIDKNLVIRTQQSYANKLFSVRLTTRFLLN